MDSVGFITLFVRKPAFSCAALLLSLGCSSGDDSFHRASPLAAQILRPNGAGLGGEELGPVFPNPPPGEIGDPSSLVGHWFVDKDGARFDLVVHFEAGRLGGTFAPEGSTQVAPALEHVTWETEAGHLRFRVQEDGRAQWFAINITEGVMTGRYATVVGSRVGPASWAAYSGHLSGWRNESFNDDIVPRVFDIAVDDGRYARLRIDRNAASAGEFIGELKIKGTAAVGSDGELPAQAIVMRRWTGSQLVFDLTTASTRQHFTGSVNGRTLEGTMVDGVAAPIRFSGARGDILSYGLRTKTVEARRQWQERARRILAHLMMAGNPAPTSTAPTVVERPLFLADQVASDRDDDSGHWQQQYRLSDVVLDHVLPNPYGPEPLTRRTHGFLSVPSTPPPADGYPLVLSLNGHLGSAQRQFQPDDYFWYADAYARRGYVVLALDISHRPLTESTLYGDPPDGDNPETGNHAHPAIAAPGLDSDWADDGERVWDAMRGIDFLLAQEKVNPGKIIVTGLSMGGEVTEIVGALDPRVTVIVPSGAPPDLSLMGLHRNHPCWQWSHGDANEFVDMSDYLAMVAPRQAIVESGKWDYTYSSYAVPYAVEKENAWRARIAYGDEAAHLVHYLHSGGHQYRVGDASDDSPDPAYIQVPQLIAPPGVRRRSVDWEVDGQTVSLDQTLFDYLAR